MLKRKTVSVWCCDSCDTKFLVKPTDGKCSCCDMVCGLCVHYTNRGWCTHGKSTNTCADRDGDYVCDIESFEAKE